MHSFLLIGQSNMAGRGSLDEAEKIDNDKLFVLRNGRWQPMYRPVNADRPFSGVCLAESFADLYSKEFGEEVGLIPCADGGTSLDQWEAGGLLFDHAVMMSKLALRTSEIKGILWHQGEAECTEELYPLYKEKFTAMIHELRKQLELSDVPVVIGGLGDYLKNFNREMATYYPKVNEQLKSAESRQDKIIFVPADGLTAKPDNLHFNTQSLQEFGVRYYEAFRKIYEPSKHAALKETGKTVSEMEKL